MRKHGRKAEFTFREIDEFIAEIQKMARTIQITRTQEEAAK